MNNIFVYCVFILFDPVFFDNVSRWTNWRVSQREGKETRKGKGVVDTTAKDTSNNLLQLFDSDSY
jgi:hypothetical protein